jgi:hypothetical protein
VFFWLARVFALRHSCLGRRVYYQQKQQQSQYWFNGVDASRKTKAPFLFVVFVFVIALIGIVVFLSFSLYSITVLLLSLIGITCSMICLQSPKYFHFESLRNDTFYDDDKKQPPPFEWATEANVGLFRYEILDLYEDIRMPSTSPSFAPTSEVSPAAIPTAAPGGYSGNNLTTTTTTLAPSQSPQSPPTAPLPLYDPSYIPLDTVLRYNQGRHQFQDVDGAFTNAQRGAIVAPILAVVGTMFGLVELLCCTYVCSWFPTAFFLYLAFMMQLMTLFLFVSDNFW